MKKNIWEINENYYLDNVRKEISRIFHSGQIDITEECYEHFNEHKKTDSEYWGNYFEDEEKNKGGK